MPKHGSRLNMAETKIGLWVRNCLGQRIGWKQIPQRDRCLPREEEQESQPAHLAIH
jgi:hypothetical protein